MELSCTSKHDLYRNLSSKDIEMAEGVYLDIGDRTGKEGLMSSMDRIVLDKVGWISIGSNGTDWIGWMVIRSDNGWIYILALHVIFGMVEDKLTESSRILKPKRGRTGGTGGVWSNSHSFVLRKFSLDIKAVEDLARSFQLGGYTLHCKDSTIVKLLSNT